MPQVKSRVFKAGFQFGVINLRESSSPPTNLRKYKCTVDAIVAHCKCKCKYNLAALAYLLPRAPCTYSRIVIPCVPRARAFIADAAAHISISHAFAADARIFQHGFLDTRAGLMSVTVIIIIITGAAAQHVDQLNTSTL